jgi:hypothetical protein
MSRMHKFAVLAGNNPELIKKGLLQRGNWE